LSFVLLCSMTVSLVFYFEYVNMHYMDLSRKTKIKLKELGVGIVYLFGSRAIGRALKHSDYDIGVVFVDFSKAIKNKNLFVSIYNILSEEFPDNLRGPKLDISFLQKSNAALEIKAMSEGIVLFEINPKFRADYETEVVKRYDDYRFIQQKYEEATFAAFTK